MEGYMPQEPEIGSLSSISLATQIICIAALTFFVALRYVAKLKLKLVFWYDDVFCAIAYVFYMAHCACSLIFTYLAGPISSDNPMTSHQMEIKYKVFYIGAFFYVPMILFTKLTLLFLLLRIFHPHVEKAKYVYIFVVLVTAYYIAIFFVKIFICSPIQAYWQDWQADKWEDRCLNRPAVILADSGISVVTDVAILIFPIALTWSLNMPVTKKLGVISILGAGCIAVAFSLYRLVLVALDFETPQQVSLILKILLTDNAEGGLGLICTCLPAFNKFVHHLLRRRRDSRNSSGGSERRQMNSSEDRIVKDSRLKDSRRGSSILEGSVMNATPMVLSDV
ncbi:hypothetical protein FE257_003962 [Aspergillus nanangensis]|uniref:Rhodopsin domain-containing protein n=1 Tax=Aspergillus nanangensis TaxID=2582783 RepID=A0AAD4CRR8_ASPNN|nr:hypothetical protein FE257_003962 [Aspergillus nanangensis]